MPLPATTSGRLTYRETLTQKPLRWWHEAIIDDMLQHPLDTLQERGARLGYSAQGLKMIINSDLFQAAYKARRERYSQIIEFSLAERMGRVAEKGLEILTEQLEKKRDSLPFGAVAETTLSIVEKLGFGAKPAPSSVVQINAGGGQGVVVATTATAEQLDAARSRLREIEAARLSEPQHEPLPRQESSHRHFPTTGPVIEGTVNEVSPPQSDIEELA